MVFRHLSALCAVGLLSLAGPGRAAEPELPLSVDGAVVVEDNVRVGGASKKGARVALYRGAGCQGEPVATTSAEGAGRFTVASGGFVPPFTISLRASDGRARSACFDLSVKG